MTVGWLQTVFDLKVERESTYLSVLDLPPIQLLLHLVHEGAVERPPPHAGLNVEVDDLDESLESIRRHGGEVTHIREPEPAVPLRIAMCRDPDGNRFELRQIVSRAAPT